MEHLRAGLARLWHAVGAAASAWQQRRGLQEMLLLDDRTLKDLGVCRSQAEFMAHGGVWFGRFWF